MEKFRAISDQQTETEAEMQMQIGKLIVSHLEGRRDLARAIFNALMPYVSSQSKYNLYLKSLTNLTLVVAGEEEENLEYRDGERPRLSSVQRKQIPLDKALNDLPKKL